MDRTDIYYWKCDRAAAFHGTGDYLRDQHELMSMLEAALRRRFGADLADLALGCGQGNHRTFTARLNGEKVFIRTEDGEECDNYFAVEAAVTERVAALGVPVPRTLAYDVSRDEVPFAWQIIPFVEAKDLNSHFKAGTLDFVHKDLALWNILGTENRVLSFIDWDDAIIGDQMDDLSLMGCFHGAEILGKIMSGYESVRPLSENAAPRFWLGLLRNMLFKAVIRVGAGYFKRDDKFFLVADGGESLEEITRRKIETALRGLEKGWTVDELGK